MRSLPTPVDDPDLGARARLSQRLGSTRLRLAATLVLVMAAAGVLVLVTVRTILFSQLDERIDLSLVQERREFEAFLKEGIDPATGRGVGGNLRRAGILYLERNVLDQGEAVFVLKAGMAPVSSFDAPYDLHEDPALRADLQGLLAPALRGLDTPAGPVRFLAVPVFRQGERTGTVVFANFLNQERGEVEDVLEVVAQVTGVAVLLVGLIAWTLAGGVLRPLRQMTDTARRISEEDLTRRLRDPGGQDEVAVLVRTFNTMLDRLERGMTGQRAFLADAGHDLRTPLTIVHGHIEQLQAGIVPADEEPATLALVQDEVRRMARLVDDLLLLARAEQPDFLRIDGVDIGDLAVRVFRSAAAIPGPEWRVEPGRGAIEADAERLIQAALNLVANAARHSPSGAPVTIGTSMNGSSAALWVADSGPGVPSDERGVIFERFARGADRRRAGTGLGLAIARTVAEAHGGRIEVTDGQHGGARFALIIPIRAREP